MRVTVVAKLKNGPLWEAVKKAGSQSALARILGINPSRMGDLLNFKWIPKRLDRLQELERRLVEFAGITLEECFPVELRAARKSNGEASFRTSAEATQEISISELVDSDVLLLGGTTETTDRIDTALDQAVLSNVVNTVLCSLTPRQEKILRMRFGIEPYDREYTLQEVAEHFYRTPARIRAIEAKALRNLRGFNRSQYLKEQLDVDSPPAIRLYDGQDRVTIPINRPEFRQEVLTAMSLGWAPSDSISERRAKILSKENAE